MLADRLPLAATVILLLPMVYFLFTSLTFFLATFTDPVVTRLLRGLFSTYFLAVLAGAILAIAAFLAAGLPLVAAIIALVAVLDLAARRWFLSRMDAHITARDAGDASAIRRLRHLHISGILFNAAHTLAVFASIPQLFPRP